MKLNSNQPQQLRVNFLAFSSTAVKIQFMALSVHIRISPKRLKQ